MTDKELQNERRKVEILEKMIGEKTRELNLAKLELMTDSDYLDNIIRSTVDCLLVVNPDSSIKTINQAVNGLLGYREDELIGKPVAALFAEEEEEEEEEEESAIFKGTKLEKLIKAGSIRDFDATFKTKAGEKIPVSFSGGVMRGIDNKVIGIVVIARDMRRIKELMEKEKELATAIAVAETEKKRAEELAKAYDELKKTQAQLVQAAKLSTVGQLAAGVAHELNSPLAGLRNYLDIYKDKAREGTDEHKEFTLMLNAANHMAEIVANLTAFSRKPTGELIELDLHDVIESTLSFAAYHLTRNNIKIIKNYSDKLLRIKAEKAQLQQVITNIITNARDAMPSGGEFIINTRNAPTNGEVIMEFIDSGTGIKSKDLSKIFEPFYTTKQPGKGTGLGLSVSREIVGMYDGDIEVESEYSRGTKFTIYLPMAERR